MSCYITPMDAVHVFLLLNIGREQGTETNLKVGQCVSYRLDDISYSPKL